MLIAATGLTALLYYGRAFFITLLIAVIISFLLEPFVAFFVRLRLPRGLSSFLVCSMALLALYFVGLGLYTQTMGLAEDLPLYSQRINELIDNVTLRVEQVEKAVYEALVPKRIRDQQQPPQPQPTTTARRRRTPEPPPQPPPIQEVRIRPERPPLWDFLYSNWRSFYQTLLMASFVPFLVYFMLSWRDHIRRGCLQLFQGPDCEVAGRVWEGIAVMARAYVVGNFLLGLLLTAVSSSLFWFVRLPYPLLIGPLSGFLSLVPYIGLPLSMLPPLVAALPVHRQLAWYLLIGSTVAFLHLLALNLLYPKIVGSRVHLNPLVVTIALMFWGSLWGGIGLVLAIPITAGIKAVCDTVPSLEPYGRLLGD